MHRLVPVLVLAATAAASAQQASSQARAVSSAVIRGRVIEVLSGEPVAGVAVAYRLEGSSARLWLAETDAEGRFVLSDVPAGAVEVWTSRPGYVDGAYGQRRPLGAGQVIELAGGGEVTGLDVRVWKEGSVSGRVMGPTAQPIGGVPVVAMRAVVEGGRRHLQAVRSADTDASGRYEIRHLSPSRYAVALVSSPTDPPSAIDTGRHPPEVRSGAARQFAGYPTTYHPGATRPNETSLMEIKSGEDRGDIDFTLADSPAVSLSGSVSEIPRASFQLEVSLRLAESSAIATTVSTATARVGSDGRFRFPRVAAGAYRIRFTAFPVPFWSSGSTVMTQRILGMTPAFTTSSFREGQPVGPLPPTPTVWAELPVVVGDRDLAGLTLVVKPGARISGRVEFRGVSALPTSQQLLATPVAIMSADVRNLGLVPVGRIEANGDFTTVGVPPGRYAVEPMPTQTLLGALAWNQTWRLESTMVQGQVVTDDLIAVGEKDVEGVTAVFTDSRTELTGLVRDVFGAARPDATLYVFPTDPGSWGRAREVLPTRAGRFKITGLPTGDYFLAAVTGEPPEHWNTPAFLGTLIAMAERVAVMSTGNAPIEITVR